ncbi:MarR family transcriptional regulator [Proteiniclasticum sp. QWL-01]|uniref:MarR family winged helix-turn-helix transcriptional regulator n=1 Tax=Proteiniclasticum sp. QWL-01 TaxID=3036945 RepID=UPI00220808E4|nr:MarR family transcriptional regulator [Proteiniclasticum sp. QWL-01]UUM13204.1 MarR family transcriptional regulator [Clostridiaceae bacterium HFYG-1003]WFF71630.1 MarR family transcriptional regulator [Proteiniclasticum sp. QWL-01]
MNESLKLENQLCFAVYALSREITKIYRPFLHHLGLTYTQYLVMIVLWEKDGIALKDLGKSLNLDSGTLTPLLKKLEVEGLIDRKRDFKDERNLLIYLTESGQELLKKAEAVPQKVRCRIPLEDKEISHVRSKLQEMLNAMMSLPEVEEDYVSQVMSEEKK